VRFEVLTQGFCLLVYDAILYSRCLLTISKKHIGCIFREECGTDIGRGNSQVRSPELTNRIEENAKETGPFQGSLFFPVGEPPGSITRANFIFMKQMYNYSYPVVA
jgi:hypothetical protein